MNRFFYIERYQAWISIKNIVAVFRNGTEWTIVVNGMTERYNITDAEYTKLLNVLNDLEDDWKERGEERQHRRKMREKQD